MRRLPSRSLASRCPLLLATLLVVAAPTRAASHNHFGAGPGANGFFVTRDPTLVPAGGYALSSSLFAGSGPLSCRGHRGGMSVPVRGIAGVGAVVAWGVTDYLELSLHAPMLGQSVTRSPDTAICPSQEVIDRYVVGAGDPQLSARLVPFPLKRDSWYALALQADVRLPAMRTFGGLVRNTAFGFIYPEEVTELFGDDLGALRLAANPGARWGPLEIAGELGALLRPPSPLLGQLFGSELQVGIGARLHTLTPGFYLVGDAWSRVTGPVTPFARSLSSTRWSAPTEAMVGVRYDWHPFRLKGGVGGAVLPGYGSPALRVAVTATFNGFGQPRPRSKPLFDMKKWVLSLWNMLKGGVSDDRGPLARRPKAAYTCPKPGEERELFYDPRCPQSEPDTDEDEALEGIVDKDIDELEAALCPLPEPLPSAPAVDAAPPAAQSPSAQSQTAQSPTAQSPTAQSQTLIYVVNLRFPFDGDRLEQAERERLGRELAELPLDAELSEVAVRGHADDVGAPSYNLRLSEARAQHVVEVLGDAGFDATSIRVSAAGEADPLLDAVPQEALGVAANRRVRVVFRYALASPQAPPTDEEPAR